VCLYVFKGGGKDDKVYCGWGVGGEKRLRLVHEYSSKLINRRNPRVGFGARARHLTRRRRSSDEIQNAFVMRHCCKVLPARPFNYMVI